MRATSERVAFPDLVTKEKRCCCSLEKANNWPASGHLWQDPSGDPSGLRIRCGAERTRRKRRIEIPCVKEADEIYTFALRLFASVRASPVFSRRLRLFSPPDYALVLCVQATVFLVKMHDQLISRIRRALFCTAAGTDRCSGSAFVRRHTRPLGTLCSGYQTASDHRGKR